MNRIRRLLVLLILVVFAAGAEVYKWVDEDGVVHYSERPPEDGQVSKVEIDEAPAEEERTQAEAIYQETVERARSRRIEEQEQSRRARKSRAESLAVVTPERERCFEAWLAVQELEKRGQVYQDEAGKVHHWDSLHSFWYESYRKRLGDSDRRNLLRQYEEEMGLHCDMPKREVGKRADAWHRSQLTGQCRMARAKFERLRAESSKTPKGTIDSAEELIAEHCN